MLAKFSYLAFGFTLGAALLLSLATFDNTAALSKTSRLNSTVTHGSAHGFGSAQPILPWNGLGKILL